MIVITTPTGQIGRQVLGNLLESGVQLRVIARDPSQLPAGVREDLDIVKGSHGDAAVADKADSEQSDYAPLGACPAHSEQHADGRFRRTLREVCTECSRQPRCHAPSGGQTRGVPEMVVVVLGEVGPLEQRVILPGGQGGWPQQH
jgi:hypothetical protein